MTIVIEKPDKIQPKIMEYHKAADIVQNKHADSSSYGDAFGVDKIDINLRPIEQLFESYNIKFDLKELNQKLLELSKLIESIKNESNDLTKSDKLKLLNVINTQVSSLKSVISEKISEMQVKISESKDEIPDKIANSGLEQNLDNIIRSKISYFSEIKELNDMISDLRVRMESLFRITDQPDFKGIERIAQTITGTYKLDTSMVTTLYNRSS
jgi:hypothetical protein